MSTSPKTPHIKEFSVIQVIDGFYSFVVSDMIATSFLARSDFINGKIEDLVEGDVLVFYFGRRGYKSYNPPFYYPHSFGSASVARTFSGGAVLSPRVMKVKGRPFADDGDVGEPIEFDIPRDCPGQNLEGVEKCEMYQNSEVLINFCLTNEVLFDLYRDGWTIDWRLVSSTPARVRKTILDNTQKADRHSSPIRRM